MVAAQLERGAQTLVGVRRRHPDVDDRDVRAVLADRGQQRDGSPTAAHDVVAARGQQMGEAVAQEAASSAITMRMAAFRREWESTVTTVGPPGGLAIVEPAVDHGTRSSSPDRPRTRAGSAPPRAVVAYAQPQPAVRLGEPRAAHRVAPLCLATFASSSAAQK